MLDNLSNGFFKNIEPLMHYPAFQFIEGDIRNPLTCLKACKDIDCVSHQAALGSVKRSIENPIDTNEVNITGFLNMLIAARDNGIKRFVYASSSSVYGDDLHELLFFKYIKNYKKEYYFYPILNFVIPHN